MVEISSNLLSCLITLVCLTFVCVLLLLFAIIRIMCNVNGFADEIKLHDRVDALKNERDSLIAHNKKLNELIKTKQNIIIINDEIKR